MLDSTTGTTPAGLPFPDFESASTEVLRLLQSRFGLGLWMVTRAVGADQVILATRTAPDSGYEIEPGASLSWDGSLCAAMVAGQGPSIAPRAADVPAYAAAPNRAVVAIEAYAAVPLLSENGALFGTLCGFDPTPQPESLREAEPLLTLLARLLATVLRLDLERDHERRRAERAEVDAGSDALTGLANRRTWDVVLGAEEARSRRYGHPASVIVIDLNDLKTLNDTQGHAAGDDLLRTCARVLSATARDNDLVARLGGDEFAVLAVETDAAGGQATLERVRRALQQGGIPAAAGLGVRASDGTLTGAWQDADRAMYADKAAKQSPQRRVHPPGGPR